MTTILSIVIYVALFYFMMRYGGCGGHSRHRRNAGHGDGKDVTSHDHRPSGSAIESPRTDPVCGMAISDNDSYSRVYRGHEYRFCSRRCLDQFEKDPEIYLVEKRLAS